MRRCKIEEIEAIHIARSLDPVVLVLVLLLLMLVVEQVGHLVDPVVDLNPVVVLDHVVVVELVVAVEQTSDLALDLDLALAHRPVVCLLYSLQALDLVLDVCCLTALLLPLLLV